MTLFVMTSYKINHQYRQHCIPRPANEMTNEREETIEKNAETSFTSKTQNLHLQHLLLRCASEATFCKWLKLMNVSVTLFYVFPILIRFLTVKSSQPWTDYTQYSSPRFEYSKYYLNIDQISCQVEKEYTYIWNKMMETFEWTFNQYRW